MLQYSKIRIPVLVTLSQILLLKISPAWATLTLQNCQNKVDLEYPTIRVYDAADDVPNYNNNGTVLLQVPKRDKALGWVGLECTHRKPVRWAFDLDFLESGIVDSYALTARDVENFHNTSTYSFRAEVELQIFTKHLDFVMSCVTFDNICEKRVTRAYYSKVERRYVLHLLSKREENITSVAALDKAVVRNQNLGQGLKNDSSCKLEFSLVDEEKSYLYFFIPTETGSNQCMYENGTQVSRSVQDRQLMENAYLFADHLGMHCATDYCRNNKNETCCLRTEKTQINKHWPLVIYLKDGNVSTVAFAYFTFPERSNKSLQTDANNSLKYAWEGTDRRNLMLIEINKKRDFWVGDTITVTCISSAFLFSFGTLIGYSSNPQKTNSLKKRSMAFFEGTNESLVLTPEGRRTTGILRLPEEGNQKYELTVHCISPVWNSSTEWVNVSRSFEVFASTIPTVHVQDEYLSMLSNSTLTTFCNATGQPLPDLELFPPDNTTLINITRSLGNDSIQLDIHISRLDETHGGVYNCVATSSRGGISFHTFELRIRQRQEQRAAFTQTVTIVLTSVFSTIVVIFIIVLSILLVRFRMEKEEFRRLTEEAIQEFYNGADTSVLPAHAAEDPEEHLFANDSVKCLPYNNSYEVAHKNWSLSDTLLGSGAFGLVRRGTIKLGSREPVIAVKTVKSQDNIDDFRATLLELKIMAYIGEHPNIVKLIAASTDEIKNRNVLIGVELCSNGSLHSYLEKRKKLFHNIVKDGKIHFPNDKEDGRSSYVNLVVTSDTSTIDLYKWSHQIASGMEFLETKKVLHADLATRNVLLTEDLVAKISDFGLSRELFENSEYTKSTQVALPWKWMAIESLKFLKFSPQTDVWSYGVTLHEIFTLGEEPYSGQTWSEEFINLLENGMRLSRPQFCTDNVYSKIMMQCWQKEPNERIEFADAKSFFEKAIGLLTSVGRTNDQCEELC